MTKSKKWTAALLALGLGVNSARAAEPTGSAQPTQSELMAQIDALKAKVNAMEQKQASFDSRDIDATVAAVLKDADRHSMVVDSGAVTAGWDKSRYGFFISSEDGASTFHPGLLWQFRNVTNYRQNGKPQGTATQSKNSDTQNGFENSRLKPYIDGTLFTKDLSYKFQWAFDRNSGALTVDDAIVQYVFAKNVLLGGDLAVKAGQYKPQVFHEEYTGDQASFAADRSLANQLIGGTPVGPRVQGVSLLMTGANTPVHGELMFHDGDGSVNTDFQERRPAVAPATIGKTVNKGAAGRIEYKFFGDWKDQSSYTSHLAKSDLLIIGGGIDASEQDHSNSFRYSADVQYKMAEKLSAAAAVYGVYIDSRNVVTSATVPSTQRHDLGGMAQLGYEINPAVELFGRYSLVHQDHNFVAVTAGQPQNIHEITAGVNWYLGEKGAFGNHAKITVDATYLPNGSPADFTQADILKNANKKDEFILRAQFQLWI